LNSKNSKECDYLIIGAGLAGLACASDLQKSGASVLVIDKGRGLGGRCATRRILGTRLDHGAQFFTARTPRLQAICDAGIADGWLGVWNYGYPVWRDGQMIERPIGHPRYVPFVGMSELAKVIGQGVNIQTETQITRIVREGGVYVATDVQGNKYLSPNLLLNLPPEQLLAIAPNLLSDTVVDKLQTVTFNPCWAVFGVLEADIAFTWPALELENHPVLGFISRDHTRRKPGAPPALLLHANGNWTREHFDKPAAWVQEAVIAAAREVVGGFAIIETQSHRWKYAQPQIAYGKQCEWLADIQIGFCGDWCEGARVEGAITSGWALATKITGTCQDKPTSDR
jgi:renalase